MVENRLLQEALSDKKQAESERDARLQIPVLAQRIQNMLNPSPKPLDAVAKSPQPALPVEPRVLPLPDMRSTFGYMDYEITHPNSDRFKIGGEKDGVTVVLTSGKGKSVYGNIYESVEVEVGSRRLEMTRPEEERSFTGRIVVLNGVRRTEEKIDMDSIRAFSGVLDIIVGGGDQVKLVSSKRTMSYEEWIKSRVR